MFFEKRENRLSFARKNTAAKRLPCLYYQSVSSGFAAVTTTVQVAKMRL